MLASEASSRFRLRSHSESPSEVALTVGHFSCECPDKPEYHVRALTHKDVEEIMQDYAARQDSAALADAAPSEAPSAPSEAESEAAQGFPSGRE